MAKDEEGAAGQYLQGVLRGMRYRATWPPNGTIRLGSVGILVGGVFQLRGKLSDFGVSFQSERATAEKGNFVFQSNSGVKVTYKAAGDTSDLFQVVGKGSAGALVEFSRAGAIVFSAPSCTISRITNIRALEKQLSKVSDWRRRYVVVTEVVHAKTVTILASSSNASRVELRASADAPIGASLAGLSSGVKTASSSDVSIEIVASGPLTPLYKAEQFRRSLLRSGDGQMRPAAKKAAAKKAPAKKAVKRAAKR